MTIYASGGKNIIITSFIFVKVIKLFAKTDFMMAWKFNFKIIIFYEL